MIPIRSGGAPCPPRIFGLLSLTALLATAACGEGDSPVAPQAPEPQADLIQTVTVDPGQLSITGSCDHDSFLESSGNGEFALRFLVRLDGTDERVSFSLGQRAWSEGTHEAPGGNLVFTRNVTRGEDFILRLEGTEYDGLLGADAQFRGLVRERSHSPDRNGRWSQGGTLTLTGSKARCGVELTYSIAWQAR
jgi:hypothetical protein